ncbi:hypothetical protein IFM89_022719 [Coptis chinensis]|uniref:Plant disease resistance WDH domain-containing protein n=1 Tax=Coptis chinensis TaxID=261450 RepID=A0A835IEX6_9MAGN|nr:hypothetical protein IFM89_022719 [Coptis chinensis]
MQPYNKRTEVEAASMLVRFGIARSRTKEDCIHFQDIVKLYSCKRGVPVVAQAVVQAVSYRGFTSMHLEHLWAACFLVFGFGSSLVVELNVSELLVLVKRVVLPLAIHTFITFSRCNAALELLRVCTEALEAKEESLVSRVEKWLNRSYCWGSAKSDAQLNPYLWQELAMLRAAVLETRAKLMLKGGHYDIADDLIRKTVHIRTSIYGEHHPDTVSARETQSKITRLLTNKEGN